jgi:uncharacterized membrane protein
MEFGPLIAAAPQIKIHLAAALAAFVLGSIVLLNRKGTRVHKFMGWTFVILMTLTAASAIFIRRTEGIPNIAGFTPIHAFVLLTAVALPRAILHIRAGRVSAHAGTMIGLYIGALLIAGALTFLPGRIMHRIFFG